MSEFEQQENAPRGNPAHQTAASRRIVLLEAVEKAARGLMPTWTNPIGEKQLRLLGALEALDTARAEGYPR